MRTRLTAALNARIHRFNIPVHTDPKAYGSVLVPVHCCSMADMCSIVKPQCSASVFQSPGFRWSYVRRHNIERKCLVSKQWSGLNVSGYWLWTVSLSSGLACKGQLNDISRLRKVTRRGLLEIRAYGRQYEGLRYVWKSFSCQILVASCHFGLMIFNQIQPLEFRIWAEPFVMDVSTVQICLFLFCGHWNALWGVRVELQI